MFRLLMCLMVLSSSVSFGAECLVEDYDQYQNKPLSKQIKRILKKKGYTVVEVGEYSNFGAGEVCVATGSKYYCSLVIYDAVGSEGIVTSAGHLEGKTFVSLYREIFKSKNFQKIDHCSEL